MSFRYDEKLMSEAVGCCKWFSGFPCEFDLEPNRRLLVLLVVVDVGVPEESLEE
jgi:hypothetical protein